MKILLSIKPEYVKKIMSGEKKYEYRKRIFKQNIDSIIVYACKPCGLIVGEIIIDKILCNTAQDLWNTTKQNSEVSKEFFFNYFKDNKKCYAIKIQKFIRYNNPVNPYQYINNFKPPQSYKYIDTKIFN